MPLTVRQLCLLALLAGGTGNAASKEPLDVDAIWRTSPATMFVDGDTLHYYGPFQDEDVESLRQLLAQAPATLSRLEIASPGGDGVSSIAIGEMIRARDLEVVVVGRGCGSGCANYVFTPARRKALSPGSMVIWHYSCPGAMPDDPVRMRKWLLSKFGTPSFDFTFTRDGEPVTDPQELRKEFESQLDDYVEGMITFGRKVRDGHQRIYGGSGIDDRIICLTDHLDLPEVTDEDVDYSYTLSIEDMARFGVCGVAAPDDYVSRSEAYIQSREDIRHSVGVVRLADHPEFQPRYDAGHCDRRNTETTPPLATRVPAARK